MCGMLCETYRKLPRGVLERIKEYRRSNLQVKVNKIIQYATWRIRYAPEPYRMRIRIEQISDTLSKRYMEYPSSIGQIKLSRISLNFFLKKN
jgi:hypothetical protein